MKNSNSRLGLLWAVVFLILGANPAAAGGIGTAESTTIDQFAGWPPSELSGWFFNGDSGSLFPSVADPSQPWTSVENLATLNAWASLVAAAGDDPVLLAKLTGLGMIGLTNSGAQQFGTTQDATGNAPEPALLGLLGSGAALLGFYAAIRALRMG